MSLAFIKNIDITPEDRVVVVGQSVKSNLKISLSARHHIEPPSDGIWSYDLNIEPFGPNGVEEPSAFEVDAAWIGDENAKGVRVFQSYHEPVASVQETVLRKAHIVDSFTEEQKNAIMIQGASFMASVKQLVVDVSYGGGCFAHDFVLEWDGKSLESFPPQYNFNLVDLSEYDPCRALVRTQLRFDINTSDIKVDVPSVINLSQPGTGQGLRVLVE